MQYLLSSVPATYKWRGIKLYTRYILACVCMFSCPSVYPLTLGCHPPLFDIKPSYSDVFFSWYDTINFGWLIVHTLSRGIRIFFYYIKKILHYFVWRSFLPLKTVYCRLKLAYMLSISELLEDLEYYSQIEIKKSYFQDMRTPKMMFMWILFFLAKGVPF